MKIISLAFILFLAACSVTKQVDKSGVPMDMHANVKDTPTPSAENQQKLFRLIALNDLADIESGLKSLAIENFTFENGDGNSPADVLFLLNSPEKSKLFSQYGLSIYLSKKAQNLLLSYDLENAELFLNRYQREAEKAYSAEKERNISYKIHNDIFNNIQASIRKNDIKSANQIIHDQGIPCSFAFNSIILNSIANKERPSSKNTVTFLSQIGCANEITSAELNLLYKLEARRVYQDRFSDAGLFLFILNHEHLREKMISIGDFGLRISPWYLFSLSKECTYSTENLEPQTDDNGNPTGKMLYMHRRCNSLKEDSKDFSFSKDVIDNNLDQIFSPCKSDNYSEVCSKSIGFKKTPFNLLLIVNNKRLLSSANENPNVDLNYFVYTQIEGVIYGFNTEEKVWRYIFKDLFEPAKINFAPDESPVKVYPYAIKNNSLIKDYQEALFEVKQATDLPQKKEVVKSLRATIQQKYTKPYVNAEDKFVNALPHGGSPDDRSLSYKELEVEILVRLDVIYYLNTLVDNMEYAIKYNTSIPTFCAEEGVNIQDIDEVSLYQMSLRQAPPETLLKWDLLRSICVGYLP